MADEVPSSRPSSPDNNIRVEESLRRKVAQAFSDANGNPRSGKWGILVNLLQTTMARAQYKYFETTTDVLPSQTGPTDWPDLPETEEEWHAMVRRNHNKRELQAKVENWQNNVKPRSIAEVPETNMLPPSFPNHLETSTPPVNPRRQPSPIELAPDSSPLTPLAADAGPSKSMPPSSSPRNHRRYGRSQARETPPKRQRSPSPGDEATPAKKPRPPPSPLVASVSSPSSPKKAQLPFKLPSRAPFTPQRKPLPKMADLIAASENNKREGKEKAKSKEKEKTEEMEMEKDKESDKGKQKNKPTSNASSSKPASSKPASSAGRISKSASSSPKSVPQDDAEAQIEEMENIINWEAMKERIAMIPPVASPTKSLSSIDGSNSEFSQESIPKYSQFNPQGASTQPMGQLEAEASVGTTENMGGFGQQDESQFGFPMRYESQMDVEANLQGVERLLNEDVGGYTSNWGREDEQWDVPDAPSSP
uniref:Uncharacterized protein n=1 Tax=Mycena chlorophos TaxID=658473 RepID=A0ABQ0MBV9_MYCCL|nr:predicted protein [Mycena chlorophos]